MFTHPIHNQSTRHGVSSHGRLYWKNQTRWSLGGSGVDRTRHRCRRLSYLLDKLHPDGSDRGWPDSDVVDWAIREATRLASKRARRRGIDPTEYLNRAEALGNNRRPESSTPTPTPTDSDELARRIDPGGPIVDND